MRPVARTWIIAAAIALSAIGLVAASSPSGASRSAASPAAAAAKQPKAVEVYATYYGWYDNTPPGCATAYSGCARGTGTYKHPITFASDIKEFRVGTILYYPTIEKYVRMGDDCQECDEDWSGKGPDGGPRLYHVDIWIGGKGGNEFDVINCEDGLTQGMPNGDPLLTPFIENPPSNMPVSTEPLFNSRTNHCFGGSTTATTYGRYKNVKSGKCLEDPGYSATSGASAGLGKCTTRAAENIAFDGAFFVVHNLCLQTQSGKYGAAITFATCNGNDRQQWEIDPNGTIEWIQYTRCIADVSGKVELARCTSGTADRWDFTSEGA
ncbi:MAG TPA: ricin-type beta-trefoil lectin domain protein [Streptosporangiaceae bacterium]|nr:ricin-type beta-trefoil lectin domain protein [Streptosporangiaceae bacterium]